MRSRYSAYVRGLGAYLVETCTAVAAPDEAESLSKWGRSVGWAGLQVGATEKGGIGDDDGEVSFVASFVEAGELVRLSERSRFVRIDGRWKYVRGEATTTRERLGRNDRCPCGSGRKLKQCHS